MKTYTIRTKFVFSGEFYIKARDRAEAIEFVERHCNATSINSIHSSLPDEDVNWNFPVHPEKIIRKT